MTSTSFYEKNVFNVRIRQATKDNFSSNRETWKNLNANEIQSYKEIIEVHFNNFEIDVLLQFCAATRHVPRSKLVDW